MRVIQYRHDHHGGYALLEDDRGERIWRFRDHGQYGMSDNKGAILELGHTRDYLYEHFDNMFLFTSYIHELSKEWVILEDADKRQNTFKLLHRWLMSLKACINKAYE